MRLQIDENMSSRRLAAHLRAAGHDVTVMVHEAVHCDRSAQLLDSYLRYEWWDAAGRIITQVSDDSLFSARRASGADPEAALSDAPLSNIFS